MASLPRPGGGRLEGEVILTITDYNWGYQVKLDREKQITKMRSGEGPRVTQFGQTLEQVAPTPLAHALGRGGSLTSVHVNHQSTTPVKRALRVTDLSLQASSTTSTE